MPTPTYRQPQHNPGELFTNRKRATLQFTAALDRPQGADEYRMLHWWGVGGQGKTALLEEFERILKRRCKIAANLSATRPAFALVDFDNANNRAIATALLSIREQARRTAGVHCPTFEAACLRYLMLAQPGASITELRARFFSTGSEVLDGIVQALNTANEFGGALHALPGFGLISKYGAKLVGIGGKALHSWWERRGKGVYEEIEGLTQDKLLRRLPSYLGLDMTDAVAARPAQRTVIMMDTYDALWRGYGLKEGPGGQRVDDWIRLLVRDSPGVLFVLAGREPLHWSQIEPNEGWDLVIERHQLGGLIKLDAEALLAKWQVAEAEIRERMVSGAKSQEFGEVDAADEAAEAYLPFYLELQAQTYGTIRARGDTPMANDFGGHHPQILARFLEHLDSETDKLLRLASYLSALHPSVLDWMANVVLGGSANADWSRLFVLGLVSEERDGVRFLHDLLRGALQERERRERPDFFRDLHHKLTGVFLWLEDHELAVERKTILQDEDRHILTALRHAMVYDERAAVDLAIDKMDGLEQANLRRTIQEACRLVLPIAERAFGAESDEATILMTGLAQTLEETELEEAESLCERVVAIKKKLFSLEHAHTATAIHNLAGIYYRRGRLEQAEAAHKQVLDINRVTLGPDAPSGGGTLHGLALVYRKMGRLAEAEAFFDKARALSEARWGADHPWTARTLDNLADLYVQTGRYAMAEPLFERVQTIRTETLGAAHPDVARVLHKIALIRSHMRRNAEAIVLYEQSRAIFENIGDSEEIWVRASFYEQAKLYCQDGRHSDAIPLFERVLAKNPDDAEVLGNLAAAYQHSGQFGESEALYTRALVIDEQKFGQEHPRVARRLSTLGKLYRDVGRYAAAENCLERACALRERIAGPEHPSTAAALVMLADLYGLVGRYADSERLGNRALEIRKAAPHRNELDIAEAQGCLAVVYATTQRSSQAEALLKDVLKTVETKCGPEDGWTGATLHNLGHVYLDVGRYAEAEELLSRARAILEQSSEVKQTLAAISLVSLAGLFIKTNRHVLAEALIANALQIFANRLPPRHPLCARLLVHRGELHAVLGHSQEAARDFQEAMAIYDAAGVRPEYRWYRCALDGLAKFGS